MDQEDGIRNERGGETMQNIKASLKGKILTLEVDLAKELGPSKSNKSINIATTAGNVEVPGAAGIKFGLNVYRKA